MRDEGYRNYGGAAGVCAAAEKTDSQGGYMKKNRKAFHIRRQTASAMAVVLAVLSPGVFPAGLAMAESVGTFVPTAGSGYVRATESDAGNGFTRFGRAGGGRFRDRRTGR